MSKPTFKWDDPFLLNDQLTDEERMIRDTARKYCQDKLQPRIWRQAVRNLPMEKSIFVQRDRSTHVPRRTNET